MYDYHDAEVLALYHRQRFLAGFSRGNLVTGVRKPFP